MENTSSPFFPVRLGRFLDTKLVSMWIYLLEERRKGLLSYNRLKGTEVLGARVNWQGLLLVEGDSRPC